MLVLVGYVATSVAADVTVYLKPNANWLSNSARFAVYLFNADGNTWLDMVAADEENVYKATFDSETYPTMILCRMNPSTTENNFNEETRWNQTDNIPAPTANTLYTLAENTWSNGAYTTTSPYPVPTEVTLTVSGDLYDTDNYCYYTTFSSEYALDFTDVEGMKAYIGKKNFSSANNLDLTPVTKVPAGTGLLIKADSNGDYTIPVLSGTVDAVDNDLKAALEETEYSTYTYVLTYDDWSRVFSFKEAEQNIAAGTAYLELTSDEWGMASEVSLNFTDVVVKKNVEVNFVNDKGWKQVYAYVWTDGENPVEAWPGKVLYRYTMDDTNTYYVYTWQFQADEYPAKVLFHNGENGDAKSIDLDFVNAKQYQLADNEVMHKYTATFVDGGNWGENATMYGYTYRHEDGNDDVALHGWTEVTMGEPTTTTIDGVEYNLYTYTSPYSLVEPNKIIFHNGTTQTANLDFENGKQYSAGLPSVYVLVGEDATIFPAQWDAESSELVLTKNEDDTYSYEFATIELSTSTPLAFKVVDRGNSAWVWYPANNNVEVTVPEDGTYNLIITFDGTNVSYTCNATTETFTVGEAGWATAKTAHAVDFSNVEGLKAYTATVSGTTVTLNEVGAVPAATALVLKGVTAQVPIVASADEVTDNNLYWYDSYTVNDSYATIYGLTVKNGTAKFAKVKNGETFTNKAVIEIKKESSSTETARELNIVFGGETTGINAVASEKSAEGVYNLNGQRVYAPAKGLYIVNGKKVVLK